MVALLIVIDSGLYFESSYRDRFYPGVHLDGKSVSGKTYSEVFDHYKNGADALYNDGITFIFDGEKGEQRVNIPVSVSGLSPDRVIEYFSLGDWEKAIKDAYDYGRSGSILERAKDQISALTQNIIFDFPTAFQSEAIRSFYTRELEDHFKQAVPAQFISSGSKITVSKEILGEGVDFNEISKEVNKKLSSFDPTPIYIKAATSTPSATKEKLEPFLPVVKEILSTVVINFKYQDYGWKVSGKKLITWLTVNNDGRLSFDRNKLESFLYKNIIPVLDDPAQNSRFEIKDGVLTEVSPGKTGNIVDIEKTTTKAEEAIFGYKRSLGLADSFVASLGDLYGKNDVVIENGMITIPIDLIEAPPRVTKDTIQKYGIKDLVGSSTTNFKGSSADRIHNIEVGVSKFNGLLIAPGEEFSAVSSIGTTTEEEGFVKEFVIKDNKSVKEFGGGLCQVATTLFRLALDSGLPITERRNHRYVVSYYGPGLDATIYDPYPDLRFVNDTGHYLLIQGEVKGNELKLELFGQKDGRQVDISKPILTNEKPAPETKYVMDPDIPYATMQCSETPRKGVTANVVYTVERKDGKKSIQNFKSVYQPWQKICLIGTRK